MLARKHELAMCPYYDFGRANSVVTGEVQPLK